MSRVEINEDPLTDLIKSITEHENTFGSAIIRLVIARKDGSDVLYDGRIDFTYKNDPIPEEITYDYGKMLLVLRVISKYDLLEILKTSTTKILKIKDLNPIHITGLDKTKFHLASKMRYLDVLNEWSCVSYKFSVPDNVFLNDIYDPLIKTELRTYPDGYEAVQSFLDLNQKPQNNNPYGLRIIIPDYSARINSVEISDDDIKISVEIRESSYDNLLIKLFAKNINNSKSISEDLQLPNTGIVKFRFSSTPSEVNVYLIEKKSSKIIDYRDYGNFKTKFYEGMTIKTSKLPESDLPSVKLTPDFTIERRYNPKKQTEYEKLEQIPISVETNSQRNLPYLTKKLEEYLQRLQNVKNSSMVSEIATEFKMLIKVGFTDGKEREKSFTQSQQSFENSLPSTRPYDLDKLISLAESKFRSRKGWLESKIKEVLTELRHIEEIEQTSNKASYSENVRFLDITNTIDAFYTKLIREINTAYHYELYPSVQILIRKLFENYVIDILRKKYKNDTSSYLNTKDRYHQFHIIIANAKQKIEQGDFNNVKRDFEEVLNWISKLRDEGNKSSHSITVDVKKPELDKIRDDIVRNVNLLHRIFGMV